MDRHSKPGDHRRKWDREAYKKLANDRIKAELEAAEGKSKNAKDEVKNEPLKQRTHKVDLVSKLGKSVIISKTAPQSQSGGYYCENCDCVLKDSISYLDHINGKSHQENLGMSMRIERSTLEQVKNRLESNKKKMNEKIPEYNLEQRVQELKKNEEQTKEYRKEKRKEKKRKADEAFESEQEIDPEIAKLMGFTGFASSKR